ncbi:hypothetical protein [Pseudomonas fluorescens]|uniref:hypothetical protein n=1 Tax=Pseudomonas fluorescens TaxID=294 RepID=UPI001CA723D6|nr:hypothetical protein [Pseudomonas fluorescens]MBY8933987.1 hypothetical protein [Pseudomonas fluorescens]
MQINIADIWTDEVKRMHAEYVNNVISRGFPPRNPIMYEFLFSYARRLALACPHELRFIIEDVERTKTAWAESVRKEFDEDCARLFDYGRFSTKGAAHWNAYSLCQKSSYRLCPYCQQGLAITIFRDKHTKSLRPTLDHFYPKKKYPFLALSLYNLIPSCHSCNSSLKGDTDFYTEAHLHPYENDEVIRYDFDVRSYLLHRESGHGGVCPEVAVCEISATHPLSDQSQRSIETFVVKERLALSQWEINRFIETILCYSDERLNEINANFFSDFSLTLSKESALGFARANYKNEWLGAIKRDLYDLAWNY